MLKQVEYDDEVYVLKKRKNRLGYLTSNDMKLITNWYCKYPSDTTAHTIADSMALTVDLVNEVVHTPADDLKRKWGMDRHKLKIEKQKQKAETYQRQKAKIYQAIDHSKPI